MIKKDTADKIKEAARIADVVAPFVTLKGNSGLCPFCSSKKGFSIKKKENYFKCFKCNKGGQPVNFIMMIKNIEYEEALRYLAGELKIVIEEELNIKQKRTNRKSGKYEPTFRDLQLRASGLSDEDQRTEIVIDDNSKIEIDRYQAATLNERGEVIPGDDMVMHYIDLHGKRMHYFKKDEKGNILSQKPLPLIRVRWQNPELHKSKDGTPMKYQSPYRSGSHLWIPNITRRKFESGTKFNKLFIQEGEKKADKATKHGMISVGIMGIHNLANEQMLPHEFELIIKKCGVTDVVFVLDSDYNDLSNNYDNGKPADQRPKSFLAAVRNFKDYFYAFSNVNIHLNIYFAHVKPNEQKLKGIDDLLIHNPDMFNDYKAIVADFEKTMREKKGEGTWINCHNISGKSEHQLREYFHLESKEAFAKFHAAELKQRKIFKLSGIQWKMNEKDELELAQPLMDEEMYWKIEEIDLGRSGVRKKYSFNYKRAYRFLFNRGFGRLRMAGNKFRFVQMKDKVVGEVEPYQIKDFMVNFTEAIDQEDVLEMLYRGAKMYFGPDSLSNLKHKQPEFHRNGKQHQYFYFKNKYWKITAEKIEEGNVSELDGHIWDNKIIDFDAHLEPDLIRIEKIKAEALDSLSEYHNRDMNIFLNHYHYTITEPGKKAHWLKFLENTSTFFWELGPDGKKRTKTDITAEELWECQQHMLAKMTGIGYMLHRYYNSNVLKAVVAMDGKLSEVGSSHGRTGKSIVGDSFNFVMPTVFIGAKRKDLTEDRYIFGEVDERTCIVHIDDTRVNFDFEFFFPTITGRMQVEDKHVKKTTIPREDTPKLYICTNHAINGEGPSFNDRKHQIAFSDWYGETDGKKYAPWDDFGQLFFDEWDSAQWNYFYNTMATCIQMYFRFGLIDGPRERLERRQLRQSIGEQFMDWANAYYDKDGTHLGEREKRDEVQDAFYMDFPYMKKYIDIRQFKKKLIDYCRFAGLHLNPGHKSKHGNWGGDLKSGSVEYFNVINPHQK